MEKMWLYPENETPFVSDFKDKDQLALIKIEELNNIIKKNIDNDAVFISKKREDEQKTFNSLSAVCLEKENIVEDFQKETSSISEEEKLSVSDFYTAQEVLFDLLEKEPWLYPELLENLHIYVSKNNLDVADYDKGRFRSPYSKMILMSYFEPVEGRSVRSEMNIAMTSYAYKDDTSSLQDVFERIAKLHAQIVRIQPFMDGNKRIAFLTTNAMLKLHNLPIIDICQNKEESEKYHNALRTAIVKRDVTELANIFTNKVINQQQAILKDYTVANTQSLILNKNNDIQK